MCKFQKCIFVGIAIPEVPISGIEEKWLSLSMHIESVYIYKHALPAIGG